MGQLESTAQIFTLREELVAGVPIRTILPHGNRQGPTLRFALRIRHQRRKMTRCTGSLLSRKLCKGEFLHADVTVRPAASPASTAWKPPANLLDDHELTAGTPSGRSYRTSDDDDSPTSASTGPITPGLPSSLSSTRSSGSVPALLSSSSRSHSDVSPSSGSYKFEHAYGLSPANSHTINDAQLFDAFASSLPSQDYSRPVGSHSSRGSLKFGTSTDTLRSHALSNSNLPAQLDLQMGGLNISRDDKAPRSFHPFGLAFSPISPIDGRR